MQAAVVSVVGQPPRYQEFANPVPAENEILIHMRAAGLHPVVKALAAGTHYMSKGGVPFIPGIDGVGTKPDGSRVYFGALRRPWGTFAEFCAAPETMCVP